MECDPVFDELSKVLVRVLGKRIEPVRLEAKLIDEYGADSMDMVELADRSEEVFKIHFVTEDIPALSTVNDMLSYIKGKLVTQLQRDGV